MARKQFVVIYPDGSKKNIGSSDREQMLLAGDIRQKQGNVYQFTGQVKTFHALSDLAQLLPRLNPIIYRRFYPGLFRIKHKEKTWLERLESPESMQVRLEQRGALAGVA